MLQPAIIFATAGQPLFGSVWLALLAVLAGIAVFLALVVAGSLRDFRLTPRVMNQVTVRSFDFNFLT